MKKRVVCLLLALTAVLSLGVSAMGEEEDAAGRANELLAGMTLDEKIYQLFIVTPEQLAGETVASRPVGGVVYMAAHLTSRSQTTEMIENIQSGSKIPLFIAVDEEGGTVARLGSNAAMGTTAFPPMADIGATGDTDRAYAVGYTIGSDILALGFNLDFAPVADVKTNPQNKVIGSRAFGSDPAAVADMVAACVRGFEQSGVMCALKHFPGHGNTSEDSHYGAATTYKTLEEMAGVEFLPFSAGMEAGAPMVMVGHITAPNAVEDGLPASLSYTFVTDILRRSLGFDGLVVTDGMGMQAITDQYASDTAAVMAIQAGVDILLMPGDFPAAVEGIRAALADGTIPAERLDESVLRILTAKIDYGIIK